MNQISQPSCDIYECYHMILTTQYEIMKLIVLSQRRLVLQSSNLLLQNLVKILTRDATFWEEFINSLLIFILARKLESSMPLWSLAWIGSGLIKLTNPTCMCSSSTKSPDYPKLRPHVELCHLDRPKKTNYASRYANHSRTPSDQNMNHVNLGVQIFWNKMIT